MTYTIKYKPPGGWFWRTIKKVEQHWIDDLSTAKEKETHVKRSVRYWGIKTSDDAMTFIPLAWGFKLMPDNVTATLKKMSAEAGQPIQRAK